MNELVSHAVRLAGTACVLFTFTQPVLAQGRAGGFMRLFGEIPAVTLVQLEEVQKTLNLTEEQKSKVSELNDELRSSAMEVFQDSAGDFEAARDKTAKLFAEFGPKFHATLKEPQQKRAEEIYVQVNGGTALLNEAIAAKLKITSDQKKKLQQTSREQWESVIDSFQDLRDMSDDEREKAVAELIESRDKALLAVLNDEQKQALEKLKGEKLKVELDKLPGPGR